MRADDLARGLERIDVPDEDGAQARGWNVVRAAFDRREPAPRPHHTGRLLVALAAAVAVVAAALSPPGRAVFREVRERIGVERAAPALFSLPAPGRLLVESDSGAWIVRADGSKRLLGSYREASWSPFGRYVAAARPNELLALEDDGDVRWSLARRDVRFPRWGGSRVDTRIAYLAGSRLHVVAGDGTGDSDAGGPPPAARVAPAWRPGPGFVLAYADTRGRIHAYDAGTGSVRWRSRPLPGIRSLEWTADGTQLLVVARDRLVTLAGGRPVTEHRVPGIADVAVRPGTGEAAVLRRADPESVVTLGDRVLFRGTGDFGGLEWSPDGRMLLVTWPTADQWVFVRADGRSRIAAVSNVREQFGGGRFPSVAGWCCAEQAG